MRIPIRSEPDAFRFTWAFVAVVGLCILLGYLVHPLAGVALFVLLAAAAVVWAVRAGEARIALRDAEQAGHTHPADHAHRILVVANEAPAGEQLREEIVRQGGEHAQVEFLSPVLTSRSHFFTTDVDRETQTAQRRLAQALKWAREQGFVASGHVGDPIDPFTALEDELRRYDVDEVIVATHPLDRANWLEGNLLERLREQLGVPVAHIVIDRARGDGAPSSARAVRAHAK